MEKQLRLEIIIDCVLKGLVFLLPLFFLPWSASAFGMDNFNKQYLLWLAAPILFFLWVFEIRGKDDWRIKLNLLDLAIILYLIANSLATVFSFDRFASVFGGYGVVSQPLVTTMSLVVIYFVVRNLEWTETKLKNMLQVMIVSWAVVVTFMILQVLGFWGLFNNSTIIKYYVLAFGNLEELAIYLSIMSVLAYLYFRSFGFDKSRLNWLVKICLVLSLLVLTIINFSIAWWLFLIGMTLALILPMPAGNKQPPVSDHDHSNSQKFWQNIKMNFWPLFLILFSVIALAFHYFVIDSQLASRRMAMNLQLDYTNSIEVARASIVSRPFTGFGPDTYSYTFSRFRSAGMNGSEYWNLRFLKSGTYILEQTSAIGLVGIVLYFALILILVYGIFKILNVKSETDRKQYLYIIFPLIAGLIFSQFFYSANILLLFLLWSLFAIVSSASKLPELNFGLIKKDQIVYNLIYSGLFILMIGWTGSLVLAGKYWLADLFYNMQNTEAGFTRAVYLNPNRYNYQVALARLYLDKARMVLAANSKDLAAAEKNFNDSIKWAKRSLETGPNSILAYETTGSIYRDLSQYSQESQPLAVAAFERAATLEPTNPVIYTEIGKLYLDSGMADKALAYFNQSTALKSDYGAAKFFTAKALASTGHSDEAIAIFKTIAGSYNDTDVYYEMGLVSFDKKNYDDAIADFSEVLKIAPLHANAMYSLGLSYEAAGDTKEALYYFKKVSDLNPGNTSLKNKIKELEKK